MPRVSAQPEDEPSLTANLDFVDPFFSSGVHIAMTGALSAALTICASIKAEITEETAQEWHDAKVGIAHTR